MLPVLSILVLSCASAALESQSSWTNLSGLNAGQKIQIIETNSKKHSGTFLSVSDSAINFQDGTGERSVQKPDVRTVKLQNSRRLRNTLIGTGLGAGVGAAIGAASTPSDGMFGGRAFGAAAVGAFGLFIGAPVGALMPTRNTIYSVK